jgi:penicillin-binding protein 2
MTDLRAGTRVKVLAAIVAMMFAALTTRLWFLQVLASADAQRAAESNAVRLVEVQAPRGRILDEHGRVLVKNRPSLVVTMNREEAGDRKEEILFELSRLLDIPADELGRRLDDPTYYVFNPIPIATDVSRRVAFYLKEHGDDFPGVDVVEQPVRTYPEGSLAAHVLGYLGQISQAKLDDPSFAGYRPGDTVGVAGIESVYEHDLAGTDGVVKYRVNSTGRNLGPIGQLDPTPGNDVELTLDMRIQKLVETSLVNGMASARGVLDPTTGAIQALTSYPTFQPSLFTRSISTEEFDRRFNTANTGYPLVDRATQGQYPPGSTYKPMVALSALQREIVTTGQSYPCPSSWTAPYNADDPQATQYVFNNWTTANLGYMNLGRALSMSCDTVFYPMGYRYWDLYYVNADEAAHGVTSHEPLQHDLGALGFGQVTNVDLPNEQDGRVPDAAWKSTMHEQYPKAFPDGQWYPGDDILMTIGQGDTLVTPLQLAVAYGALQNNGRICVPHLLGQVISPSGEVVRTDEPNCKRQLPFAEEYLAYVRNALVSVPRTGTAQQAFLGFPFGQVWVAGKTGTAEVTNRQDYSWFAAMTSADGEQHVIVVLVEQGGHGSTTAAPIVRNIIEGIYGLERSDTVGAAGTD